MKRTMLICLCVSTIALCTCASLAEMKGTPPNATGDTVIDKDTVWRGENIVLGGDLTVQKGRSFTIDACDVLFNVTCPKGKMVCRAGTTIVIKDSYLHGRSEFDRAAGIVLGGGNDRLTVKISGTTFKYLGTWDKPLSSPGATPVIRAVAIYKPGSFFRGNSIISDSIPALPPRTPKNNWTWGLRGPREYADAKPEHGIKVENCYFFQTFVGVGYNKYLSGSCIRGSSEPLYEPVHHFVSDANWFEDSRYKPYNLFGPSHHGLTKDNYFRNTGIAFTTTWIGKPRGNVFVNNIMLSVFSRYLGHKESGGAGGWGDESIFIGNEIINCDKGMICSGGKDWIVAGNKFTNVGGRFGFATQAYPGVDGPNASAAERERYKREKFAPSRQESIDHLDGATKRGTLIIGNKFDNYGSVSGGICVGVSSIWGTTYWKDVTVAGNEITNCKARGIWLSNTNRAVIKNNTIKGNGTGIEISPDSTDCNVVGNKLSGNKVDVKGSASNTKAFPEAKIVSPEANEFKAGRPVTFRGSGAAKGDKKIVSYWWFFGDGTMSTKQNPTHTFKRDGKYFVAFLVSDSAGLRDIAILPGRIDAVWNQSDDPLRPWPERKPRLAAYPNPLFLKCGSPATFVPYYYMGKVVVRISDATGKVVREIDGRGFKAPGVLDWDLKDAAGKQVSPGKYRAVTLDKDGEVARCGFVVR